MQKRLFRSSANIKLILIIILNRGFNRYDVDEKHHRHLNIIIGDAHLATAVREQSAAFHMSYKSVSCRALRVGYLVSSRQSS